MKTYVIGLTTFREIVRRPIYWLLFLVAAFLIGLFVIIPYFTFGEDVKMLKDQGLAVIMLAGLIIGILAASVSISEEIEGRTALTLLSKPVDRRAFILGKFGGIMSAIGVLFVMLTVVFLLAIFYKIFYYDATEADELTLMQAVDDTLHITPGIVLTYFRVMIIVALSVAFSTRLPLHLNVTACVVVFLLAHLSQLMTMASAQGQQFEAVEFMARFFVTILPGLEFFNVGPAISTETDVPWLGYVVPAALYAFLYSGIALLLALLMFEDRDLA